MQAKLNLDHQTRAIGMATGGAALAAILAMFIPTGIWEALTGSTGFSELVPATAAPLGDTARALISFGFGVLTFAVLAVMLLRKAAMPKRAAIARVEAETSWNEPEPVVAPVDARVDTPVAMPVAEGAAEADSASLLSRLRTRVSAFAEARRGAGNISDLEDLPKLRSGDAHPDAPPRRPFSANRDLAEPVAVAEMVAEPVEVEVDRVEAVAAAEAELPEANGIAPAEVNAADVEADVEEHSSPATAEAEAAPVSTPPVAEIASLDEMVNRFENALAERDSQLAHMESLADALQASNVQPIRPAMQTPLAAEPAPVDQAPLRAVESIADPLDAPQKPESEELDAALRSALETLHRMNARIR